MREGRGAGVNNNPFTDDKAKRYYSLGIQISARKNSHVMKVGQRKLLDAIRVDLSTSGEF